MCHHISPAAAHPHASTPMRGRAAVDGVVPTGCRLVPGDLMELVRIDAAKMIGEPRWDGWTEGTATQRLRVTLFKEDLEAITAAGYTLPRVLNHEVAVNIPFYLGKEQDRFMWRIALVVPAPKPSIVECRTAALQPGDVIRQQIKSQTKGTLETRLQVIQYNGKIGSQHQLVLKNLATDTIDTFHWSGGDHVIIAGPKCEAYAKDPSVCLTQSGHYYPQWIGGQPASTS